METINNKISKFDTAIDDNVVPTNIITGIEFAVNDSQFVGRFLSESMLKACEWMIKNNKENIHTANTAMQKEVRNNPEQPDEQLLGKQHKFIKANEAYIEDWKRNRDVILNQIRVAIPDYKFQSSNQTVDKTEMNKLIKDLKAKVATKSTK
tara:strand:- start:215 stop:667 length:453 start_codon:yes stop_codon:yes gene_type:complete